MTRGRAESLGDEFEARLAWLEWRAHADSCSVVSIEMFVWGQRGAWRRDVPTLTAVLLPSSSEFLLPPPCLLLMLSRLELRFGRIMALMGLGTPMLGGDPGGETAAIVCTATATPFTVEECAQTPILFRRFPRGRID